MLSEILREAEEKYQRLPFYKKLAYQAGRRIHWAKQDVRSTFRRVFSPWRRVKIEYGLPVDQRNLAKYFSQGFFEDIPNPYSVDFESLRQELATRESKRRFYFTSFGRVAVATDPDYYLGSSFGGWLSRNRYDGKLIFSPRHRVIICGLDQLMSEICDEAHHDRKLFTHLKFQNSEVSLVPQKGALDVAAVFDQLPNPLPRGEVLQFFTNQQIIEAQVRPIPQGSVVPQLCLIGPTEQSDLFSVLKDSREESKMIVVGYKYRHGGLIYSFIQHERNPHFDVINLGSDGNNEYTDWQVRFRSVRRFSDRDPSRPELYTLTGYPKKPGIGLITSIPLEGQIESFIRCQAEWIKDEASKTDGRTRTSGLLASYFAVPETSAVFGVDVVETGRSATAQQVIPINFKNFAWEDPEEILRWKKEDNERYLEYVRLNSIMPVQPVAVQVKVRE